MTKVMMVDDDDRILESFGRLLRTRGFDVTLEEDPALALDRVMDLTPDLIISDMRMKPIDGVEFMKKIPEKEGFFPAKIIFTAFDDGEALELAKMAEGGVFRVEKDRWETDLEPAIMRSLELKNMRREAWEEGKRAAGKEEEVIKLRFMRTMAVTLGHQINNPLQTISSANYSLAKEFGDRENTGAISRGVERIRDVTNRLTNLTEIRETPYPGNMTMLELS